MEINWSSAIASAVTPIAIVIAFKIFSQIKSLRVEKRTAENPATPEELELYQKYMRFSALVMLVTAPLIGFLIYYSLLAVAKLNLWLMQPYDAAYPSPNIAFAIPALFSGLLLSYFPFKYLILRKYGKETYQIMLNLADQHYGFDNDKLGRIMIKWGLILCILFYANFLKTTSYIFHDKIRLMGFLSLRPNEFPLQEVKEIVVASKFKAPNGNIVQRHRFFIVFKDGFEWDMDNEREVQEFLKMLQFKTGVPAREVEFHEAERASS